MKTDHRIDRLFGPTGTFAGYSLVLFGVITTYFYITGLILVIAGLFMALTYEGTLIDFDSGRIKPYTSLFGVYKQGKWYNSQEFSKFYIYKSRRSSTVHSRGNVPLTIKTSDIRLSLLTGDGSLKVIIDKYDSFEAARAEMSELIRELKLTRLDEWKKP